MAFTGQGSQDLMVKIRGDGSDLQGALAASQGAMMDFEKRVAAVQGALAALGGVALYNTINSAREYNDVVREMTKVSDAETAQRLADDMDELASKIPLSTTEIGELITEAKRFGIAEEHVKEFTETAAQLAVATDISVDQASQALAKLANVTGVPIPEIENLGSTINTLGQTTAASASDILDSMTRSSATLSELGATAPEIAGLNSVLIEMFPSAERAGTALNSLASEMDNPAKVGDFAQALGMTPDEFKRMRDEDPTGTLLQLAKAYENNDASATVLNGTLTNLGRRTLSSLAMRTDEAEGAIGRANTSFEEGTSLSREFELEMESLSSKIQLFKNEIFKASASLGKRFIPILKVAVDAATEVTKALTDLTDGASGAFFAFTLLGSVVALAGSALSTFVGSSGAVVSALGVLKGALAVLMGPIGLLILAIGGLAAAWEADVLGIQEKTKSAFGAVKRVIGGFTSWAGEKWSSFSNTIGQFGSTITNDIRKRWSAVAPSVKTDIRELHSWATEKWSAFESRLSQIGNSATGGIRQRWKEIEGPVRAVVGRIAGVILDNLVDAIDAIKPAAQRAHDTLVGIWGAVKEAILSAWDVIKTPLKNIAQRLGLIDDEGKLTEDGLVSLAGTIASFTGPVGIALGAFSKLYLGIKENVGGSRDFLKDAWKKVRQSTKQTAKRVGQLWKEHGPGIKQTVKNITNQVKLTYKTGIGALPSITKGITKGLEQLWKHTGKNWVRTIKNAVGTIVSAVTEFGVMLGEIFNEFVIPTLERVRVFWKQHGEDVALIVGALTVAVSEAIRLMVDGLIVLIDGMVTVLTSLWNKFGDELIAVANFLVDAIISIIGAFVDTLATIIRAGMAVMEGDWDEAWNQIAGLVERIGGGILSFIDKWTGGLITSIVGFVDDAVSSFNGMKDDVMGTFESLKSDATGAVDSMLSQMKSAATGWVDDFIRPFTKAKDRVLGEFNDLKKKVSGNSIVPDMFDETVSQGEDWTGDFLTPLENVHREALSQFGAMESGVTNRMGAMATTAMGVGPMVGNTTGSPVRGGPTFVVKRGAIVVDGAGDDPREAGREITRGLYDELEARNMNHK